MEYRYKINTTGGSSLTYGNCEICDKYVSEVFLQSEERQYRKPDGTMGWTLEGCKTHFGHKDCLESVRR